MRSLTVVPGVPGSGALADLPEPDPGEGSVLVATRHVPLDDYAQALVPQDGDVRTVVVF